MTRSRNSFGRDLGRALTIAGFAALGACASDGEPADPQALFLKRLTALCGGAFQGRLVSTDAVDADIAAARLTMHVRECSADEIRIPFHVGDDRSRTWVVSRRGDSLELRHVHRHEDGVEDKVSRYGGVTAGKGAPGRQTFPADDSTKSLFVEAGLPKSVENIWAVDVDDRVFAYELRRPGRFFRVEFDLENPTASAPPPPWGAQR